MATFKRKLKVEQKKETVKVIQPDFIAKEPKPFTTEDLDLVYKLQLRGFKLRTVEGPNPYHKGNLYIFHDNEEKIKEVLK